MTSVRSSATMVSLCLLAGALSWNPPPARSQGKSLVNFNHLNHLTEHLEVQGEMVSVIHVYANAPDYAWVGAAESGPEGIACVDDAARAAVLCMRHYELLEDTHSLERARSLLRFVMKMQTGDGEFYNFIREDGTINTDGTTSLKSFGWWAARALWALSTGCRVFAARDSGFALLLRERVVRSLPHVGRLLERYGEVDTIQGYATPRWLLYESGADATSELLLGLLEYYRRRQDQPTRELIEKLSSGIMLMQDGDESVYPYGLHRSWRTLWHMWGNGQTQALATGGGLLGCATMTRAAEREAKGWYSRLLIEGFLKQMDAAKPGSEVRFEQIAYGVRPMAVGLVRLFEATGDSMYLTMAGLAGSWLFGNNAIRQPLYDPESGRCFDGISGTDELNKNSGAESTIEALLTILEIEQYASARKYLDYRCVARSSTGSRLSGVFRNAAGESITLTLDTKARTLMVQEGSERDVQQRQREDL